MQQRFELHDQHHLFIVCHYVNYFYVDCLRLYDGLMQWSGISFEISYKLIVHIF